MRSTTAMMAFAVLATTAVGCSSESAPQSQERPRSAADAALPRGSEPVRLDPAGFTSRETAVDGTRQRVEITVTHRTKRVLGIDATVIHDVVTQNGELVEDTWDWYAQDRHGNVWYLGEHTKEYENGVVSSTAGSWQAGVDGAQAGVILPAQPDVGVTYRQEYYKGEAEDAAKVLSIDERAAVPYGAYTRVLMTKDYTPLKPALLEHKFYARGVGPVLVVAVAGGTDREELVSFSPA
jgi:hypothetical protein